MSAKSRKLVWAVAVSALGALLICVLIILRSQHAIARAQIAVVAEAPATQPFEQAFRRPPTTGPTVRVAVIGGMVFTSFWNALAERYEKETGVGVALSATGPKNDIVGVFKQGGVDVITMHSSDAMINLAASGLTTDPQPWMRNDLVIVGPADDPAKIKGMTNASEALKKIAAARAAFVVHSSLGAQEVLLNILEPNQIQLDAGQTTILFNDQQRDVLKIAADRHAYTLVGRVPFRTGRLPNDGLVLMVEGDERLMRPYLVAVANPARMSDVHIREARRFAAYLRDPETQRWIAGYGIGTLDDRPIFFPVSVPDESIARTKDTMLLVNGEVTKAMALSLGDLERMPQVESTVADRSGKRAVYRGVALGTILQNAGVPIGGGKLRGESLSLCATVGASDGYSVVFALPELDGDFNRQTIILADRRDGQWLDGKEGPLRVIAPGDGRPARWIRKVISITVGRAGG